jgi:hypothetical protein
MADETERDPTSIEAAEKAVNRLALALLVSAGMIAAALSSRPGPPRYQAFAIGGQIVRVDSRTGAMIACEGGRCGNIHKRGQRIEKSWAPRAPQLPSGPAGSTVPAQPDPQGAR